MNQIETYTKEDRRVNGIFYTPGFLADYLASKVFSYSNHQQISSILDPACGDGILLRKFANMQLQKYASTSTRIFGIDNDKNAVISSVYKFSQEPLAAINSTFINADSLFPIADATSPDGWRELKNSLGTEDGFDVILSNPPWGSSLDNYSPGILAANFSLAKGQFDIFDLFSEMILENLKPGGLYGLILPDSVFSHEHERFRSLLIQSTKICLIARLGEKIFPEINRACVVIIGSNEIAPENHQVDCFRLNSILKRKVVLNEVFLEDIENEFLHKIPQARFNQNNNYVFDIDLKASEQDTFDKITNNSLPIKEFTINSRGAEISKKGLVCQCPNCNQWMPFPKSKHPKCSNCRVPIDIGSVFREKIVLNHNGAGNLKLKVGEDLFRYTSISKSWINTLKPGINYKDLETYIGHKILVRKTGIGVTAGLDYENSITNQVVYILKLKPEYSAKLTLEFVLAVLNSRALTYYLIKKYGENEWKSHPYLTQGILVGLPFPIIDFSSERSIELITLVTDAVRSEVQHSKQQNISKECDVLIERVIAHFFHLTEADYEVIFQSLYASEQLIPIRRLLNCNVKDIFQVDGI